MSFPPRFCPLYSGLLYLYSSLDKLAQSHDFKYILHVDDSQIYFSSSDGSLELHTLTTAYWTHPSGFLRNVWQHRHSYLDTEEAGSHPQFLPFFYLPRPVDKPSPPVLSSICPLLSIFMTKDLVLALIVTHLICCYISLTDDPASRLVPLKKTVSTLAWFLKNINLTMSHLCLKSSMLRVV